MQRDELVACARTFLGWGWRHQARGPAHIDCVGLPIMMARKLGLRAPDWDFNGYTRHSIYMILVEAFREEGLKEKRVLDRLPGDIVLLRDDIFPCHCAIVSGGDRMIHAYARARKVVEEPFWKDRATHCFEI